MAIWIHMNGERRILSEQVKEEIISMEDAFWAEVEKMFKKYEPEILKRGLELERERYYWRNGKNLECYVERPSIEAGYEYVCGYKIKKNGKLLMDNMGEYGVEHSISYLTIKPANRIVQWLYKKGIVQNIYLSLVRASDEDVKNFFDSTLDDDLPCIDIGYYSLDSYEE